MHILNDPAHFTIFKTSIDLSLSLEVTEEWFKYGGFHSMYWSAGCLM